MKVLVLHDHIAPNSRADELDALVQSRAVCDALHQLGHQSTTLGLTLDLEAARQTIESIQPDLVFNLVESIDGHGRLIHVPCSLLNSMGVAYTGCSAEAQFCTSSKLIAKQLLDGAGVPTPPWFTLDDLRRRKPVPHDRYILKSVWEHASIGLDEDSIITTDDAGHLSRALENRLNQLGGEGFSEAFIDGREFNLSLLASQSGPHVLPPAEIIFDGYDIDKPKVVGYRAKWADDSFEYHHTPRRYQFPPEDAALLDLLSKTALDCWRLFALNGHARVDFRVDHQGRPWVLEINTNPCLSPDAGFAAALNQAQIEFHGAVDRIINDAKMKCRVAAQI